MTESELARQMRDVYTRYGRLQLGPDEFTAAMFAKANGISYNQASNVIKRAVDAGAMVAVGKRYSENDRVAEAYKLV